jgi:SOS response regulatory protein OraA/RecX
MARPKLKENEKRRKLNVTINPHVYAKFIKYCEDNNITNQSVFIENIINEKIDK